VSDDYTQGQQHPAGNFYGAQGAAAELQSILDRVKDERLRLLRMLKDCEARFGSVGVVPPAEEIARLTGKVRAIDDAVRQRYNQLHRDESTLDKRTQQLDQLRQGVQDLADQFNAQLDQARSFKPELAAAKQTVQTAVDLIVQDARTQLDQIGDAVHDRLGEFRHAQTTGRDQLREARHEIEKTFAQIDDRLAAAAGLARDEARKLIEPIFGQLENHATDCGQRIQQTLEAADNTLREKLDALPAQAQQALSPARESLDAVIEDARTHTASLNDALHGLDARAQEVTGKAEGLLQQRLDEFPDRVQRLLDEQLQQRIQAHQQTLDEKLREVFAQKQDEMTAMLEQQARTLSDQMIARQRERIEQEAQVLETKRQALSEETDKSCQALTELWDRKARQASAQANEGADKMVAQLAARVDAALSEAGDRADAIGQQIHGQLTASLDQSHAEAVTASRRIEEQAREVSAKADEQAGHVARAIERSLREQVVAAMSRADAITDPFKARLEDALDSHRKLAEEFSITAETELSQKAKAHWDAFRRDTEAALEKQKQILDQQAQATVEDTQQKMRQRVEDLCASSQSMVELIEQQLTRRLKGIEPQTHQAFEGIERQVSERLGQLRDNAQSMVQLVEDQLTKRVAELQPQAVSAARDAERELNEHLARVRQEVENVVAPLRRQVIEELGQIADVGKSVRGLIKRDGQHDGQEAAATDPPVVDARKLTTPLQEMAARMGKKAAKLVGARDDAEAAAEPQTDEEDRKAA
jgi:hypothetical protein